MMIKNYLLFSAAAMVLSQAAFAATYTVNPEAGTDLDWNSASTWLSDGAAAATPPTKSDQVNFNPSSPITIYIDGQNAQSGSGNYNGVGGVVSVSNGADWDMGYVYTGGANWTFNVSDSTVKGFFAVASLNTVANFTNSTLDGSFESWNTGNGALNLKNSTFNGDIRFHSFGNNVSRVLSVSFEASTYNTKKSTTYGGDDYYLTSELHLEFIGSENTIQMATLDINQGSMDFVADENGFSTVAVDSFNIGDSVALHVDFSALAAVEGTQTFELVASISSEISQEVFDKIIADFTYANEGDIATLKLDGSSIFVDYTAAVPEPATYAAIFGALALALAAYRKRA